MKSSSKNNDLKVGDEVEFMYYDCFRGHDGTESSTGIPVKWRGIIIGVLDTRYHDVFGDGSVAYEVEPFVIESGDVVIDRWRKEDKIVGEQFDCVRKIKGANPQ
jgi:hypothetical protein